jgi:putative ABC transport system substrate-binding protein
MNRRRFLGGLILGALAGPFAASTLSGGATVVHAQPAGKLPRVVVLMPGTPQGTPLEAIQAFKHGLQALGYVQGQTISLEERWNEGGPEQWPAVVTDVLRSGVEVFVSGSGAATPAVLRAAPTIPLVSPTLNYPVEDGYAASLAHPGGSVTGLTLLTPELTAKRLELIKGAVPRLTRIALLSQPGPETDRVLRDTEGAARALGLRIALSRIVRDGAGIGRAFEEAARTRVGAVVLSQAALFAGERSRIGSLALRHRLPTIAGETGFARAGGLLEYAPDIPDNYRRAATYVDRILKGAKPGDLPIEQPAKVGLIINLKTAKSLGLTIPPSLLLRADQVIE